MGIMNINKERVLSDKNLIRKRNQSVSLNKFMVIYQYFHKFSGINDFQNMLTTITYMRNEHGKLLNQFNTYSKQKIQNGSFYYNLSTFMSIINTCEDHIKDCDNQLKSLLNAKNTKQYLSNNNINDDVLVPSENPEDVITKDDIKDLVHLKLMKMKLSDSKDSQTGI